MNGFVSFLEHHLGRIQYGWSQDEKGEKLPFQIVKFSSGPFPGVVVYTTLGLSNQELLSPASGKAMKQEFVFLSTEEFGDKNIPALLQQVGRIALEDKQAFLRGDVIGPNGKLFESSNLEAFYVTIPVYLPNSFWEFTQGDNMIIMCWLVPITAREADFISQNSWDQFEDWLEEIDPDLIDFNRSSII